MDKDGEQIGGRWIKVSRYELPNFIVNAKPNKPYYLPGDTQAEVEVSADYLFGKPVTGGKVRRPAHRSVGAVGAVGGGENTFRCR